jgi:hypothetical protein
MAEQVRRLPHPIPINALADHWIREYRLNRYLRRLTREELDQRLADIASNLLVLGEDGKYRPQFHVRADRIYSPIRGLDFLRMATEAWDEARIRGYRTTNDKLDPASLQIAKRIADDSWCRRPEWIARSRLSSEAYERPRMLFRYTRAIWNSEFVHRGRIRLSPASLYKDAAAISAVRDDELTLRWVDKKVGEQIAEVEDYYVLCMASQYDYRLFSDFQADSCVAINDPTELSLRLRAAVAHHNERNPAYRIRALYDSPIIYFDPFALAAPETAGEVHFCKHFRFAYQTEFRFVLTPAKSHDLQPLFIELGSLRDIAEMVKAPTI